MKRITRFLFGAWFMSILTCIVVWAQATAQISGTARDQSGAVLPGVEITATQTDTGIVRNTITNETGSYVLPNLAIGPYRLEAALPGFRTFAQSGIVLQVNSSPVVNVTLEVGQLAETVEVQANATLVETQNSGIGQVIENARILELPLNGRNVTDLIVLAGGATPGNPGFGTSGGNVFNTTGFSVAGGISQGVTFVLDGATHNNPANNLDMPMPFPDALQEFRVETSALSARSGMHSAGAVNVVTKSGTNAIHGDLFEFVRNYKFNARNFFAASRDSLKRNQFGGTLGGPVVRNKLFFFGGYQGTILRQDPSETFSFVPTPAMLGGDFTAVTSPSCNVGRQITLRTPFVNNRIDPALLSWPALTLAQKLPATNDPCGKLVWGRTIVQDSHQAVGRIDYQRSASHSLFGRYMATSLLSPAPYTLSQNLLTTSVAGADALTQTFTFGDTYLFGSGVVNSFRLAANRMASGYLSPEFFSLKDIGVKIYDGYHPKYLQLSVAGGFSVGGNNGTRGRLNTATFALNDDVSVVRGNHQLAFGASGAHYDLNFTINAFSTGIATFNGQATGLGLADFLTGNLFSFVQADTGGGGAFYPRQRHLGLYGQDTWKVTPRLTLNWGLRWEPYLPLQFHQGPIHFDRDAFQKGIKTAKFTNAPPGIFYPGDPGFPGKSGMYNRWWNFSPRMGLAWDPEGNGRTSIRASFGTFYDFPPIQMFLATKNIPPWSGKVDVRNVRFEDPWRDYPGGDPFPITINKDTPFPPFSILGSLDYDTHNTSVSQWNLSIQRQVGADWLISTSYLGSNSVHLWTHRALNPAIYFPGGPCTINRVTYNPCSTTANTDQRRPLYLENPEAGRLIGVVNTIDDGGTASYHGMIASIQRRPIRGATINANYTWSHCITDPYDELTPGGGGGATYTDPANRRADRGNCTASATDRRHVFNLTAVAETPQFSNPTLRAVATGWRLSPILRLQSGGYMSVTTSRDIALNGISNQRLSQVLPNGYGDKSLTNYLNPRAFALPATGTRGNMGIDNIAGPGLWQFDVALSRTFRSRENQRLEFRAEAFNVTNSLVKNNPVTSFDSSNFGQINSARDPRIMQFALKYIF